MTTLPPPIASGRTAEIYPWPDGRVLKLIRPGFPPILADQEQRGARIAYQAFGCAPQPGELVEVDGRRGVVLERISGPNMLEEVERHLYRIFQYAHQLGQLHARMHAVQVSDLPSQHQRFARQLGESPYIDPRLKPVLLAALQHLPDGDRLCHGDFHLFNVILSPRGPVVVDWEPSTVGSPVADVAGTVLKTRSLTSYRGGLRGFLDRRLPGIFNAIYLRGYRQVSGAALPGLADWIAIRAALCLFEDNRPQWPLYHKVLRDWARRNS